MNTSTLSFFLEIIHLVVNPLSLGQRRRPEGAFAYISKMGLFDGAEELLRERFRSGLVEVYVLDALETRDRHLPGRDVRFNTGPHAATAEAENNLRT